MTALQKSVDLNKLLSHHDFKRVYFCSLRNLLAVSCLKSNILLMKSESLVSLFCFKRDKFVTQQDGNVSCLLSVLHISLIHCKPCTLLTLPTSLRVISCCLFFCTQFQMSTLVIIAELVMHVFCIKHTSKHHSIRYYEASVFEILCCCFSMSALMGKWVKTYFCVQDFSILSSITCRGRGQGEKNICLLKNGELLLNASVTQNWSHWKYNAQRQS